MWESTCVYSVSINTPTAKPGDKQQLSHFLISVCIFEEQVNIKAVTGWVCFSFSCSYYIFFFSTHTVTWYFLMVAFTDKLLSNTGAPWLWDGALNSALQIYWHLLKDINCPTSFPSGHPACNLPTCLLDHLSKPLSFSAHFPPPLHFVIFLSWRRVVCVCLYEKRESESAIGLQD